MPTFSPVFLDKKAKEWYTNFDLQYKEVTYMSKFCNNCGSQLEDQSTFCPNCGTPCATAPQQAADPVSDAVNKVTDFGKGYVEKAKADKKLIIIPVVAIVAVIAIIVLLCSLPGVKTPIDTMYKITYGKASKADVKAMYPKQVWEYLAETEDKDADDYWDEYKDGKDDLVDMVEDRYGKNFKVSFKVKDKDKVKGDKLTAIKDLLNTMFGIKKSSIKEVWKVDIEGEIKGKEDDDEIERDDILIVKIGGKFYLLESVLDAYEFDYEEMDEETIELIEDAYEILEDLI